MTKFMLKVNGPTVRYFGVFDTVNEAHNYASRYLMDFRFEIHLITITA